MELYHKQRGYGVTMICLPSIKKFLTDVASIPDSLNIETVDFKEFVNNYQYFKEVVGQYREYVEISDSYGSSSCRQNCFLPLFAPRNAMDSIHASYQMAITNGFISTSCIY